MKRVPQTKFGIKEGNCLEACLASLLELDIDRIPIIGDNADFFNFLNDWLIKEFGLYMVNVEVRDCFTPKGYHMMWGKSMRYDEVDHSVIGYNGEVIFDPHPSNSGLATKDSYVVLAKLL